MLKKRFFKTKTTCKITFELPKEQQPEGIEIETISVLGDFNNWDAAATPLRKVKGGTWKEIVDLEVDNQYAFRYYINNNIWYNDPKADGYALGDQGSENCLVSTQKPV